MLSKLSQIFLVLFLGGIFAFLFSVPVHKISEFYKSKLMFFHDKHKWINILSVLSFYSLILAIISLIIVLISYSLSRYFSNISVVQFLQMIKDTGNRLLKWFPFIKYIPINTYADKIMGVLMRFPIILGKLILAILISIYLLIDWDSYCIRLSEWNRKHFSRKSNETIKIIVLRAKENLYGYWKGQFLDAIIMAFLLSLGLWFIGVPLAIPIGLLSGIGNLIPYVGPVVAVLLTTIFCLIEQRVQVLIFALIFLFVIQQIDSSIIGPKLLGKQMQIRPLSVIVSILIGGTLFGPAGMIFAVPTAGFIKSFFQ